MAAFEGTREGLALEAVEARGERQVRRGRGLRLEPGETLDGAGRRERLALEQELAREERPIQLAPREDALAQCCVRIRSWMLKVTSIRAGCASQK